MNAYILVSVWQLYKVFEFKPNTKKQKHDYMHVGNINKYGIMA